MIPLPAKQISLDSPFKYDFAGASKVGSLSGLSGQPHLPAEWAESTMTVDEDAENHGRRAPENI
jgi:hypothetical protein